SLFPSAVRISMNPPPPRFPASGQVTASASATATAASTALPPRFMTSTPTREAIASTEATMPCLARTGRREAASSGSARNRSSATNFFMRAKLPVFPPRHDMLLEQERAGRVVLHEYAHPPHPRRAGDLHARNGGRAERVVDDVDVAVAVREKDGTPVPRRLPLDRADEGHERIAVITGLLQVRVGLEGNDHGARMGAHRLGECL